MTIVNILKEIRNTTGNEKLKVLEKNKNNILLKEILDYTYNPFKIYGIKEKKYNNVYNKNQCHLEEDFIPDRILTMSWWDGYKHLLNIWVDMSGINDTNILSLIEYIEEFEVEYQNILKDIMFKDLKLNLGISTINKVWPNLIPQLANNNFKFEVQKLTNYETKDKKPIEDKLPFSITWISRKLDGINATVIELDGDVKLLGRSGKELPGLEGLKKQIKNLDTKKYVYTGEIVWFDKKLKEDFNKASTKELDHEKTLVLFNKINKDGFVNQNDTKTYKERRNSLLDELLEDRDEDYFEEINPEYDLMLLTTKYNGIFIIDEMGVNDFSKNVYEFLIEKVKKLKWEGLVLNNPDAVYDYGTKGKKNRNIYRFKPRFDEEFKIVGFVEGKGKCSNTLGSIVIKLDEKNTVNVGSGFTDEERNFIWSRKNLILLDDNLLAKISYLNYSSNAKGGKSLRQPVFEGFKDIFNNDINIFTCFKYLRTF